MENKPNEFKFSILRNFGTEQLSCTATIYTKPGETDFEAPGKLFVEQADKVLHEAYMKAQERSDRERADVVDRANKKAAQEKADKEASKNGGSKGK